MHLPGQQRAPDVTNALTNGHAFEMQLRAFQNALSAVTDFVYIFDCEGRFAFANKALLDLWGLTLDQVVGKNFFDLKYETKLAERLQRQIQQVIETRQRLSDETPYTSPSGIDGYYEYIFSPVFGSDGSVEAVAGLTREITDRKRTETLLDAQKQSLELVVSGKPLDEILTFLTSVVETQSGGESVAAILLLDDQGCLRIGAAPTLPDSYNQAIDGLKARADLGTCSAAAVTASVVVTPDIETDPKWSSIKHLPCGLGLKAAWSNPIIARDGRVLGTFGTYFRECRKPTDFERQVVEILSRTAAIAIERSRADKEREGLLAREREARAEADAANRAKDKFLAVLSHELRTPLSPVVMTIPAIESDPDLPAKFRQSLAMIRRNIDLEVKLIDDLLDLSRVSSGKLRLQMETVHVHDVLRRAVDNSAREITDKRISVHEDFAAANDRMTADPARLQQVFWNLIRNAVKFTPAGGDLFIRTWDASENGQVSIEIRDNGVGIPADLLPRIFDAFEQGDSRMTQQFGGLGLGLAIAKAVVEMHGGTIGAASDGRDKGATFTLQFNTVSVERVSAPRSRDSDAAPRKQSSQARVLLVEDHADTAQTLSKLLSKLGYQVKTAHSAALALELAGGEPFDVLLSDIGLPDATGYALMEQIRQQYQIKGIALSGYGMEDDIRKSRDAGFCEHVTKPVNVEQLQVVIDRVIAGDSKIA